MNKLGIVLTTSVVMLTMALSAGDRTVTISDVRAAVSNRLEQTDGPKPDYQVWVGIIPLTEYVKDDSQLEVFCDGEIKFSIGNPHKNIILSTGYVFRQITFELLAATFNMDVDIYLNLMTNNAVAFYFENRKTQSLTRLRLEDYDSLLEQLTDEYYGDGHGVGYDEYHTMLYCVVDGRLVDPDCKWFCAGNGTLEAHVIRAKGTTLEQTKTNPVQDVWWPVHGRWFEEVPVWLSIPKINYIRDGRTLFWEYMRRKLNVNP